MAKTMGGSPIPARHLTKGHAAAGAADSELVRERLQIAHRDRSGGSPLSLVEKCIIDNTRRLGAARVLADELADQALKRKLLHEELKSADDLFEGRPADADAACTEAVRALMRFAGIESSAALNHLVEKKLAAKAIDDERRFEGRLAGLIEILCQAGVGAAAVYSGSDKAARRLKELAAAFARKNGYQWARQRANKPHLCDGAGKMRRIHREIIAKIDWASALGSIADPQRNITLMPLSGSALDEHFTARLEVMGLWRQARHDVIEPSVRSVRALEAVQSDLRRWVEDRASFYFASVPAEQAGGRQFFAAVDASRRLHKK